MNTLARGLRGRARGKPRGSPEARGRARRLRARGDVTSVDAREIEWQFDAVDLRSVVRWLSEPAGWEEEGLGPVRVAPAGSDNHVDVYLDTDDRRFHRAGYALQIRRPTRRDRCAAAKPR